MFHLVTERQLTYILTFGFLQQSIEQAIYLSGLPTTISIIELLEGTLNIVKS
jgi:hypothetical protein